MRLGSRFTILLGVLAAAAAIRLVVLLDATVRRATEDRILERVSREADHLAVDWERWSSQGPADADGLLRDAALRLKCRITIVGSDGRVLHDTDLLPDRVAGMENQKNPLGLIHFGMWVDSVDEMDKKITAAGGAYVTGRKETGPNVYYEVKYKTPEGIVFDVTESGWKGAVKDVKPA